MEDRELLELAAKAAGYTVRFTSDVFGFRCDKELTGGWNPLTDDGDALRLALKLELHVFGSKIGCNINDDLFVDSADCGNDPCAAARRAIVRAAAEIGKNKPSNVELTGGAPADITKRPA